MRGLRLLACLALLPVAAGCLVRSVHPWLTDDSLATEPALAGTWSDNQQQLTAVFTATNQRYTVETTDRDQVTVRLTANLHRIGDTLLMQVAPGEQKSWNNFVLLFTHILYKVRLDGDRLTLHPPDVEVFGRLAAEANLALLADSSDSNGYVLTGSQGQVETFLCGHLDTPDFFKEEPDFTLRRLQP